MQWAKVSADQAYHECLAEVQKTPTLSHTVCMRSKGWQER